MGCTKPRKKGRGARAEENGIAAKELLSTRGVVDPMRTRSLLPVLLILAALPACARKSDSAPTAQTDTAAAQGAKNEEVTTKGLLEDKKAGPGDLPMASAMPRAMATTMATTTAASPPPGASELGKDLDGLGGGHGVGMAARGGSMGSGAVAMAPASAIKAGEWDDNANYREFQRYLAGVTAPIHAVDVRSRRFLVVRDSEGKGVPRCPVVVSDAKQHEVTFTTTASGRAIFFPFAEKLDGRDFTATARCKEDSVATKFSLSDDTDGTVDLKLGKARNLSAAKTVDIVFVLDTTGSMSEEIASVKHTIQKVAESLSTSQIRVRIGLVEYKDRTDAYDTKVYPMSTDLNAFGQQVAGLTAGGGGDMPEDMNAGLHVALTQLEWSADSVARLAFVIGDAPPHLDYQDGPDYAQDIRTASHKGIQLFTIAASGMDATGQAVWRQMAQFTGGTNMFVLRGGAGPQSVGGGDPTASCGGTQTNYASGNLDGLITSKVKRELALLDMDPLRIAGLRTDENAKPCDQRITFAQ